MADNKVKHSRFAEAFLPAIVGIVIAVALVIICVGCSVAKPTVVYRDSVRVEYRDRIVTDTAYFEVPVEVEKIVTRDTASHISGLFSETDAVVSGGYLYHSLISKPQKVPVPVTVHVTDTVYVEKSSETTVQEPEIVEVEKPLTFCQRFKIGAFWWLVLIAVVGWRRELLALIKKLIQLLKII